MTWEGALPPDRPLGFPGVEPQPSVGFCEEMRESTAASPSDSTTELDSEETCGAGVGGCGGERAVWTFRCGEEVVDLPSRCLETNMRKVGGSGIRENAPATFTEERGWEEGRREGGTEGGTKRRWSQLTMTAHWLYARTVLTGLSAFNCRLGQATAWGRCYFHRAHFPDAETEPACEWPIRARGPGRPSCLPRFGLGTPTISDAYHNSKLEPILQMRKLTHRERRRFGEENFWCL